MIATQGLTKRFDDILAVEDLTIDVREGEILGLLGPNGAGKTTTIRMLGCLVAPTAGRATVCGHQIGRDDHAVRQCTGLLTEVPGLYETLSARRNLELYARLYGVANVDAQVEKYLRLMDLWERRGDAAGTFSKGMKQKLALARALVHEPQVIFLDEPTAGLDPQIARRVRDVIQALHEQGRTILLCTHNLLEAEQLCDRVAVLRTRLLALDEPKTLRARLSGCRTAVELTRVDDGILSAVRGLDFVQEVRRTANTLLVALEHPESQNPLLVRRLVELGADVQAVTRHEQSLEDAYLKLIEEEPQS